MDYNTIILISIGIIVLLNVIIIILLGPVRNTKDQVFDSEKRVTNDIEMLQQAQNGAFSDIKGTVIETQGNISEKITDRFDNIRGELRDNLEIVNDRLAQSIKENGSSLEKINNSLSENLLKIQTLTEEKLDNIQKDVNRKLDDSLNRRLDESFEKVTNQLGQLYKSLGELGEMSDGIASLNKTLTNVKTRGTWGEMQLGNILELTMSPSQYDRNVKLKNSTDDLVEFALKIPSKDDEESFVYLPIDSKFPLDIYQNLLDAAESGEKSKYNSAIKQLEIRIKTEAKTIRDKYINPSKTTDFAIMFLPTESLYAEVLRINGLAEFCQTKYKVIVASPTTITALLNSLRVGFANVAINKKTAEVKKLLQAVKTQYVKLNDLIDKTSKQLEGASKSTGMLKERTRLINKKLAGITELDVKESEKILEIDEELAHIEDKYEDPED